MIQINVDKFISDPIVLTPRQFSACAVFSPVLRTADTGCVKAGHVMDSDMIDLLSRRMLAQGIDKGEIAQCEPAKVRFCLREIP